MKVLNAAIFGLAILAPCISQAMYCDDETDLVYYGYRYYNPTGGRWLSRDPAEEDQGGPNLYAFVNNDAIDFTDLLGQWTISRNGGALATAQPDVGDTVSGLADIIGLNANDYQKWLTTGSYTPMPGSTSESLSACASFSIPNTVVAEWAGNLGWLGRWYVRWNPNIKYLKSLGFNVIDIRHRKGAQYDLQYLLQGEAATKELHGLYFWGHGSYPYPAGYLVSDSGDALVQFSSLNLQYKMALGLVFACDSNSGESVLMSGSESQIWKGFSGTLVPWPFRGYSAKHYIHHGQQGTK